MSPTPQPEKPPLIKVQATAAREICSRFAMQSGVERRLRAGMSPREFVEALMDGREYLGGIDFVAHALPQREAIWWGCLCLQHGSGGRLTAIERTACKAAVQWVLYGSVENRAAAKAPADTAGPHSPGGLLAAAVGRTAVEMNGMANLIAPSAVAHCVAASVKIACMHGDGAAIAGRLKAALELGIGVAEGKYLR